MGKEPGTSVMHADQTVVANKTFKSEKEKVRISLPHKMVNMDLIANNISRPGKSSVEFNHRIQKAVTPFSFDRMVDVQVRA
jgi:hypothetical protein